MYMYNVCRFCPSTPFRDSGGQQGLLSIHMQGRFLTWDKTPSEVQLDRLREALNGEVEPLEVRASPALKERSM